LEQRRARAARHALRRVTRDDPRWPALRAGLRLHVCILLALVLFSTFNSIPFVAVTFHPPASFFPSWLQIGIRGAVVPTFFLLTGAVSPLSVDASSVLSRASGDMLHKAVRTTVRQWNARINAARKSGQDLAPVAVSLMLDVGDRDSA